LVNFLSV